MEIWLYYHGIIDYSRAVMYTWGMSILRFNLKKYIKQVKAYMSKKIDEIISFGEEWLYSTSKVNGFAGGLIAILLGLAVWQMRPNLQIPVSIALGLFVLLVFTLASFCHLSYRFYVLNKRLQEDMHCLKNEKKKITPAILASKKSPNSDHEILLLLEENELFYVDMNISCFYDDGGFELFIGKGIVTNIHTKDKTIQALIEITNTDYLEIPKKILNNDAVAIANTIIKPYVSNRY